MGTIDSTLVEMDDNIQNATTIKNMVIGRLLLNQHISPELAQEYVQKWQVIIIKKSWFKAWADKFSNNDLDSYIYKFVKFED